MLTLGNFGISGLMGVLCDLEIEFFISLLLANNNFIIIMVLKMGRLYLVEYIFKIVPLYFYFKGTFFLGLILIAGTRYA